MKNFIAWCRSYLKVTNIAVLAAIIYMICFQENSSLRIYSYDRTIDSLRTEIRVNTDSMMFYRALNQRMDNHDPEIIERIVRENHNMNLPNEDVYIYK
jgi:cell division protein FtsB